MAKSSDDAKADGGATGTGGQFATDSNGKAVSGPSTEAKAAAEPTARGKSKKAPKGSQFQLDYGTAKMKAYPVMGSELFEIGGFTFAASMAFSVAWNCFSFVIDTQRDVELSGSDNKATVEFWVKWSENAQIYGWIALGVGVLFVVLGGLKIAGILKRTKFEIG